MARATEILSKGRVGGRTTLIFVVTGTHEQPFERLVSAADMHAKNFPAERVIVQFGSAVQPRYAEGQSIIDREAMGDYLRQARVVVAHGGPSTILEAIDLGKLPLVCPRSPLYGEHVDDHQIRFVERLERIGYVRVIADPKYLSETIAREANYCIDGASRREMVLKNRVLLAANLNAWLRS